MTESPSALTMLLSRHTKRREFIATLGGMAARAQQGDRMRRIGVLLQFDENNLLAKAMVSAFTQALAGLGWTSGRNVQTDLLSGPPHCNTYRRAPSPAREIDVRFYPRCQWESAEVPVLAAAPIPSANVNSDFDSCLSGTCIASARVCVRSINDQGGRL
jgi:hypothetical protein